MAYTAEETYFIWLASIDGIGPITFSSLMNIFNTPQAVFEDGPLHPERFKSVPRLSSKLGRMLVECANQAYLDGFLETLEEKGITAVCRLNSLYPNQLLEVFAPPLTLYCKGRLELLQAEKMIAIIGTREPTPYGRTVAGKISRSLGENGVTVVSGMARGIDICAHLGALEVQGDTIAVLGCGVDIAYPADKASVYEQICREGLVISEYIPGTKPLAGNFPARNRIISGLSRGVVVVEAGERSGTNITVNYALDQGKDIFAVPGSIVSKTSVSTNLLIKSGCEVITSEEDVLEFYGWAGRKRRQVEAAKLKLELTFQQRIITDALEQGGKSFDELYEITEFSMPDLFSLLAELEVKGVIDQQPGRIYAMSDGGDR